MEQPKPNEHYQKWPADPQERQQHACEILGQHLVAAYDSWLITADQILREGYRYKSPTDEQRGFLEWAAKLSDEDKRHALALVEDTVSGVILSLLAHVDGTAGSVLRQTHFERLRLSLDIHPRLDDPTAPEPAPVESIALNPGESVELHEQWYGWLERYSRQQRRRPAG